MHKDNKKSPAGAGNISLLKKNTIFFQIKNNMEKNSENLPHSRCFY
jgi:hypothetical protein